MEVPADSDEARKWLGPKEPSPQDQAQAGSSLPKETPSMLSSFSGTKAVRKSPKGGPVRKMRQSLASSAVASRPKKISTLEMSRMEWNAHISSAPEEEVTELEQSRRAGGFLEKVDFLQRVDQRKDDARSSGKRRRLKLDTRV